MFHWEDRSFAMLCLLVSLSNHPASPFTAQNCNLIVYIYICIQPIRHRYSFFDWLLPFLVRYIQAAAIYALLHHGTVLTDSSAIQSQEPSASPTRALSGLRGGFISRLLLPPPPPLLLLLLLRARDSLITKSPSGAEKPQTFDKA